MSDNLEILGREIDQARTLWDGMPLGEVRDDVCDHLNHMAAAIRSIPAGDLSRLAAKARAAAWVCCVDLAHADDVPAEAVAVMV